MKEDSDQPLVTVLIFTYNSSEFIVETLESSKAQTYRNIELIVTDDSSTDKTVDICNNWINENKERFVEAVLVSSEFNTGIPANINRGLKVSKGIWIKYIAGDDILAKECITELMHFISKQKEDIRILSADIIRFSGNSINNGEIRRNPNARFCSLESTAEEQYKMLLRKTMVFAQTIIIRRDLLEIVHGFDERFNLLEDWPLWVKITNSGYKIYYLNKPLVFYRLHEKNLSQTTNKNYLYHPVSKIVIRFKEIELLNRLPFIERCGMKHDILGIKTCFFLGNNKKNPFTRFVFLLFNISNPFYNYLRLKNLIGKKKVLLNVFNSEI